MTVLERARKYSSRHCNGCYISCLSGDCERPKIEKVWLDGFAEGKEAVCDYNCSVHKLVTHNACLTCTAIRNSPHHDLANATDEDLKKIIQEVEENV